MLYTYSSSTGAAATGQGMAAGTSPGIAFLANGNYVVAFQANTTDLAIYDPTIGGSIVTSIGMAPGTAPSVVALSGGGYEVAVESNNNQLWIYSSSTGGANTQQGMWGTTSPGIGGLPEGGYLGSFAVAFQANTGTLALYQPFTGGSAVTSIAMASGTSPAMVGLPSGGWAAAIQSSAGVLQFDDSATGAINSAYSMSTSSSPSIAAAN